jgi:hypothetical protein
VLKFGGARALTKHIHDELNHHLTIDDPKIEVDPEVIDNSIVIDESQIVPKPKSKMTVRMVESKVSAKKSNLDKTTCNLYDLEDCSGSEKTLNIDFGLYQMEDY